MSDEIKVTVVVAGETWEVRFVPLDYLRVTVDGAPVGVVLYGSKRICADIDEREVPQELTVALHAEIKRLDEEQIAKRRVPDTTCPVCHHMRHMGEVLNAGWYKKT